MPGSSLFAAAILESEKTLGSYEAFKLSGSVKTMLISTVVSWSAISSSKKADQKTRDQYLMTCILGEATEQLLVIENNGEGGKCQNEKFEWNLSDSSTFLTDDLQGT